MAPKTKKHSKAQSRLLNGDHSESPFEASEEVPLRALSKLLCISIYPSLIAKSAFIGKVADVEDDLQGCKIWLSKSSMLDSSLVPHSIVSVSLASSTNNFSSSFPLSSLSDECAAYFGIDTVEKTANEVGSYFALATVFASSKVLKNEVRLSSNLSYTMGCPTSGGVVFVYPIQSQFPSSPVNGHDTPNGTRVSSFVVYNCKELHLELALSKNKSTVPSAKQLSAKSSSHNFTNEKSHHLLFEDPELVDHVNHAFVVNHDTKVCLYFPSNMVSETSQKGGFSGVEFEYKDVKANVVDNTLKLGSLSKEYAILKDIIISLSVKDTLSSFGLRTTKGVLLHGPPGTGKTSLARLCACDAGVRLFSVEGPEIVSKYYGESEKALLEVFESASQAAPAMVFIDELDAIAPARKDGGEELSQRMVATLLNLMDGINRTDGLIVIAATNMPDSIEPALRQPGRLDREIEIEICLSLTLKGTVPEHADHIIDGVEEECRLRVAFEDFEKARIKVRPSAMREVILEVPKVNWEDVGGQSEVKTQLMEAVEWPQKHQDAFKRIGTRPPTGILMFGPPSCSKTLMARAVASEAGLNFLSVEGPELFSKWVGESEKAVRSLFANATFKDCNYTSTAIRNSLL